MDQRCTSMSMLRKDVQENSKFFGRYLLQVMDQIGVFIGFMCTCRPNIGTESQWLFLSEVLPPLRLPSVNVCVGVCAARLAVHFWCFEGLTFRASIGSL